MPKMEKIGRSFTLETRQGKPPCRSTYRLSLHNVQSLRQLGQYYTLLFTNTHAAEPQESPFLSRVRDFFAEF
jgi:hypothetical protein